MIYRFCTLFSLMTSICLLIPIGIQGQEIQSIVDEYTNSKDCDTFNLLVQKELEKCGPSDQDSIYKVLKVYNLRTPNIRCACKILNTTVEWLEKTSPKNDSILTLLHISLGGNIKYLKTDLEAALSHFKKAGELKKDTFPIGHEVHYKVLYNQGEIYGFKNESDKSIFYLDSALVLTGFNSTNSIKRRYYDFYALAYANKGDAFLSDAYMALNKLYIDTFKINYKDRHQLRKSQDLLNLNRTPASLLALKPLLNKRENGKLNNTIRKNIGLHAFNLYSKNKEYDKAYKELELYKKVNKDDALLTTKALVSEMTFQIRNKNYEKAIKSFDEIVLRCNSKNPNYKDLNAAYLTKQKRMGI